MRLRTAGRGANWLCLALYLILVCGALLLTWLIGASEERYISGFGVDIGVSATFTDAGRWLVTAVLALAALLGLAAATWLAGARGGRGRQTAASFTTSFDDLSGAVVAPPDEGESGPRSSVLAGEETTIRLRAALVGDEVTRRSERAVPPAGGIAPVASAPPGASGDAADAAERTVVGH